MLSIEPNAAAADVWHVNMGVQPEYVVMPELPMDVIHDPRAACGYGLRSPTDVAEPAAMFGLNEDGAAAAGGAVVMWVVGTALTVGVIALGVFLGMRAARGRSS